MMAFYDLTTSMANCAEFDEALVTSTVIDDIVRCFPTCQPKYYKTVEKLISVLDPLIQFMTEALDAFFGADGLSVIVKHISVLGEIIKTDSDKQHISYLTSLLKFILKLLKQFGSNDRLRNLIEGSLFKSIKMIFEHQIVFGADVFYCATHILATFIHTEPTSLSILQEGGVPQALLSAISENSIPPNAELLIILPQAFDAICLNSSGVAAFINSDPLPNFLRFLSDPEYFRELQQNHVAVSKAMAIGEAVNEFMRHHPNLSSVIIPNLVEAVDLLQNTFRREQVEEDSLSVKRTKDLQEVSASNFDAVLASEAKRRIDPLYISMMESLCLFIESIVKTPAHREAFMAQRGVAKLLECYVTPTLPADFTNSQACASINHCFHVLSESDPVPVMADINSYINATREKLEWFLVTRNSSSTTLLSGLINPVSEKEWERISSTVQSINVFGSLVALLADLCFAQHMNFSRPHAKIVPAILEQANIEEMMQYIGHLMRCCLYEYWALRKALPKSWLSAACRFSQLSPFKSAKEQEIIPVPAEIRVLSGITDPKQVEYSDPEDVRIKNLKACLTILRQVPTSVIAFFSGLARSLASRRTVSTVLAELAPEQVVKGLEMIIKSIEFHEFIEDGRSEDIYLRNRLISAGISLTNLIFIDESNYKMTLHMQAIGIYRSLGCFDRMSQCLELVFNSINVENGFEMISVNDVLESIYGVLSRITDETLLRGNYWDEADEEKYNQLPYLFEFSAKLTGRIVSELPKLVPLLSIECLQLILSCSCNLLAMRNDLHVGTNLCLLLEELRSGKPNFTIDKVNFKDLPRFEEFISFGNLIKQKLFNSLISLILNKSKDLSFDLAQLLTRFSIEKDFFNELVSYLMNFEEWKSYEQISKNSQIISIILNSPFRCQIISASEGKFEILFFAAIEEILKKENLGIAEKNVIISAFALCSVQIMSMYLASKSGSEKIPKISKEVIKKIYYLTLDYLKFTDLSVDSVHAILLSLSVLSKDQELPGTEMIPQVLPLILKASTKCLESEDPRHKSTVSLVALILRHFIETPSYLTALFQQEMTIRFKGQHEAAFEIDDLIAFAEPFLLRNIPSAKEALKNCFGVDVFSEKSIEITENPDLSLVQLYSLKNSLSGLLSKRQEKLENTISRGNEEFKLEPKIEFNRIEIPKPFSNVDVIKILKNPENSPLASELISCLLSQLLETNFTIWPQSREELKSLEGNEAAQSAHFYRCALLLFLSELILAYPVCHSAFIQNPQTTKLFEFLLNVMAPYGNVRYTHINQAYERSWVQYLLINTCMGSIVEEASLSVPGSKMAIDKLPESMADSCKFVVNCLFTELKKQCASIEEDKELQIGKIFGLSDTIFCLLTVKSSTVGRWAPSMTAHLASLLIENRVIHLLSTALQFIDSNNPAYEEVTVNVVRTLEALCKYSNKFAKLAAKKNGIVSAGLGGVTDFSQLLQEFSSEDSGYSDDYGFESESEGDDSEDIDESGLESDTDMDMDDSEISDEDDFDSDSEDGFDEDSEDEDVDFDSDSHDYDDDSEDIIEINTENGSGDLSLSSVRGRNTRIGNAGPYELIVEEIDEEDDDEDDGMGDGSHGFPVGTDSDGPGGDSDGDVREYDYDHHNHHHMHGDADDFDSDEHDHIDHDDSEDDEDEMMEGMGLDDDDWNDLGAGGHHPGHEENIMDFMEFPGGHMRASRHHRHSGPGRHRNELNALLTGLNSGAGGIPASSYSGQVRLGADSGVHPLISRPVLDPLADPLRAHLPLTQPVQSARPLSVVLGRSASAADVLTVAASSPAISRVNAEPFHFPQAVATNRRWQQDVRFTFSDLTRLICLALKSEIEVLLSEGSADLRETLKKIEGEENRVMEIVQKATEKASESKMEDKAKILKTTLSDVIASISAKAAGNDMDSSSIPGSSNMPSSAATPVEFIDEGMDAEFFQAVPFDLYEEIIQQHLVERRERIPVGCDRVTISADFLARLPQVARDLYVRMSDEEVRAYRMFSARTSRSNTPGGSIDSVRSEVLRNLIAEVGNILMVPSGNEAAIIANAAEPISAVNLKELPLSAIQSIPIVDPSSLVSILRSYYSPVISERRLHHKLFQSLVASPRTRIELINLLIYVLERMPADMTSLGLVLDGYVESLTGVAVGAAAGVQPGKAIKRSRSGSNLSSVTSAPGMSPVAIAPLRPQTPLVTDAHSKAHIPVLQRTLQLLLHLCSHNEDVCAFFTTPVEKPWTIKRHDRSALHNKRHSSSNGSASTNNSGPATMTITTKFPLVLVMACLERAAFAESSLLIEYLLHLLDTVTAPLSKVVNPQDLKSKNNRNANHVSNLFLVDIPQFLLNSLVRTLVGCEFTPKAFQYASHVFQNLAVLSTASSALLSDLTDSANRSVDELILSLKELQDPAKVDMKKFSQSKAAPAKFLRLIKTTSSLCLQPSKEDRSQDKLIENFKAEDKEKMVEKLKKLCRFERELEETIKIEIETVEAEKLQFALVLLPVIEAFFLVHRLLQALTISSGSVEPSPVLIKFAEEHRGLLNSLIRTKPSLLTQGSLVTLTRLPRVLDFDNKRIFFRQQLHRKKPDQTPVGTLNITVQRAHVFEDSFRALQGKSGEELKWGRLSIKFAEEEGVDAGGVAREWFSVLARQMFNPDYALFRTSAADQITYQPNRMSYINPDHLLYFHFIGRIIGKAVFDSRLLDCHFTRSFYKHILRIPVETKDMEAVDPELYKSLCWIEDNDITGVFDDLTFTTEADEFGTVKSVELKENGSNIFVTEENKLEYVQLLTEFKLTTAIIPQIDAFLRGFNEIIPAHLISVFNEQELELLISGMPEIDLDDWKGNCDYHGGYTIASPQIQWFWRAVRSFDSETRAKLIQFVTGTSKVPLEGFAKLQGSDGIQKFQIHRDPRTRDRLPTAHTCFNQLDLPEYETYEELRQQLLLAINEGETGFGFI